MKPVRFLFLLTLGATLFLLGWVSGARRGAQARSKGLRELSYALRQVSQNYVDPVSSDRLTQGALRGMLRTLDPHSAYLDRTDFGTLEDNTQGEFQGIGIVVDVPSEDDDGRMQIVHNVGAGPTMEDALFEWPITGHYRYPGPKRAVTRP